LLIDSLTLSDSPSGKVVIDWECDHTKPQLQKSVFADKLLQLELLSCQLSNSLLIGVGWRSHYRRWSFCSEGQSVKPQLLFSVFADNYNYESHPECNRGDG